MSDINTLLDVAFRECEVSGPVPLENSQAAQEALGLFFPPSYRRFLEKYGAAFGLGFEIAGLPTESPGPDDTPLWSNVVRETLKYRPDSLPENSIAISHDGSEFGYFLRCSTTDPEYEGAVIEWGPAHDGGKEFSNDFLSFVDGLHRR
jgi:hypothetical protein